MVRMVDAESFKRFKKATSRREYTERQHLYGDEDLRTEEEVAKRKRCALGRMSGIKHIRSYATEEILSFE